MCYNLVILCSEVGFMPNYKQMYLKMMRASEDAINLLIKAQQECEELYISSGETAPNDKEVESAGGQ